MHLEVASCGFQGLNQAKIDGFYLGLNEPDNHLTVDMQQQIPDLSPDSCRATDKDNKESLNQRGHSGKKQNRDRSPVSISELH